MTPAWAGQLLQGFRFDGHAVGQSGLDLLLEGGPCLVVGGARRTEGCAVHGDAQADLARFRERVNEALIHQGIVVVPLGGSHVADIGAVIADILVGEPVTVHVDPQGAGVDGHMVEALASVRQAGDQVKGGVGAVELHIGIALGRRAGGNAHSDTVACLGTGVDPIGEKPSTSFMVSALAP